MTVVVLHLPEVQGKLQHPTWLTGPLANLLTQWRRRAQSEVRTRTPEWHRDAVTSIDTDQSRSAWPAWARVFSESPVVRYLEDGTKPHWPPIADITPWADDKGIPPFLVARSIARKGTVAHRMFRDAEAAMNDLMPGLLADFARSVEAMASA